MIDLVYALAELVRISLEGRLGLDRPWLLPLALLLPAAVLALLFLARRNLSKVLRVLEPGRERKLALMLLYAVNVAAKLGVALLMAALVLKPYVMSEVVLPIEEEMEDKYLCKEVLFILLIDCSHSMEEVVGNTTKLDLAKRLAKQVIGKLPANDSVVVAFFADAIVRASPLNGTREQALSLIDEVTSTADYTSIGNAISYAVSISKPLDVPAAVILFSDGRNNGGVDPLEAARMAREANVTVSTVYVGGSLYADPDLLRQVASAANGTFVDVSRGYDPEFLPKLIVRKAKYSALKVNFRLKEVMEVKDDEKAFELIAKSLILLVVVMLVTGV